MNLALWIIGLLAVVALINGVTKVFVPKERLAAAPRGAWTGDASVGFVKTLDVLELLAAVGLILPAVVDIAPFLVPVAAFCWVLLMVGAMVTHGRTGGGQVRGSSGGRRWPARLAADAIDSRLPLAGRLRRQLNGVTTAPGTR